MSKVIVTLQDKDYQQLRRLAEQERRVPPDQAAHLLEQQLRRLARSGKTANNQPIATS